MTFVLSVFLICASGLFAQYRHELHKAARHATNEGLSDLWGRVAVLEEATKTQYDHAAFEDLKNKVEAFRIAQGMRR